MQKSRFKNFLLAFALIAIVAALVLAVGKSSSSVQSTSTQAASITPAPQAVLAPQTISIPDSPLKHSIIAAGDYLTRQQLANGELSYQVDIQTGARDYSPSYIRLIAGTGSLFTV